jgi:hypothetical protein
MLPATDHEILYVWVGQARDAVEVRNIDQIVMTKNGNIVDNPRPRIGNGVAEELGFALSARASLGSALVRIASLVIRAERFKASLSAA